MLYTPGGRIFARGRGSGSGREIGREGGEGRGRGLRPRGGGAPTQIGGLGRGGGTLTRGGGVRIGASCPTNNSGTQFEREDNEAANPEVANLSGQTRKITANWE